MEVYCSDIKPVIINSFPENLTDKILLLMDTGSGIKPDYLLKQTLTGYNSSLGDSKISITKNEYGKPFVEKINTKFNISKTGNNFIIAFTNEDEIGIDIELISSDKVFSHKEIFFSLNEIELIRKDKSINTFYKLWTRKESFLKFLGTGITENVNEISLAKDRNIIETERYTQTGEAYINSFIISDEIYCSVCTSAKKPVYLFTK